MSAQELKDWLGSDEVRSHLFTLQSLAVETVVCHRDDVVNPLYQRFTAPLVLL